MVRVSTKAGESHLPAITFRQTVNHNGKASLTYEGESTLEGIIDGKFLANCVVATDHRRHFIGVMATWDIRSRKRRFELSLPSSFALSWDSALARGGESFSFTSENSGI